MARDYTKYNVEGVGENLNKRKLVFTVVQDYVEKNNPSFEDLKKAFPDEVQGSTGVVAREAEIKDPKRFNVKEPLKIKNGAHVLVCNQWGDNIDSFVDCASGLGYYISNTKDSKISSLINLSEYEPYKLHDFYMSYSEDEVTLDNIDKELEGLLDKDLKYFGFATIFEGTQLGYDYYRDEIQEYFTLNQDKDDLLEMLQEESLLKRLIQKYNFKEEDLNEDNVDFKLLFTGYFLFSLEKLIENDDEEMIAEFIFSQSLASLSDDFDIDMPDGDWLSDLCVDLLRYRFQINLNIDFEDECTIHGSYFGDYADLGYDYLGASRVLIDSMI